MIALAGRAAVGYYGFVLAAVGTGCRNPMRIGAAAPPCDTGAFFAPAFFNGGRRWATERLAGSYSRFTTPTTPATPRLAANVAVSHCIGVQL